MTDFKLGDSARIRLDGSQDATKARVQKVIELLGDNGAMTASNLADELGYAASGAIYGLLTNMVGDGRIVKTESLFHLQGQSVEGSNFMSSKEKAKFFIGDTKLHHLRRWLRAHQDEATTITRMAKAAGYSSAGAVNTMISHMLDKKVIRRYQQPEDYGFEWRYQYIAPELSGVTVTPPPEEKPDEPKPTTKKQHDFRGPNFTHHADDDCPVVELPVEAPKKYQCRHCEFTTDDRFKLAQHYRHNHDELKIKKEPKAKLTDLEDDLAAAAPKTKTLDVIEAAIDLGQEIEKHLSTEPNNLNHELTLAINLLDQYAKEFFWLTGSKNTQEMLIWLKERRQAGENNHE